MSERLRMAPPGPLTDRVFSAAAELARVAGSMQFDAGAHRTAQGHYLLAARLAKAGGNSALGAAALGALARLQFDLGAADDGLAVIALAQRGARSTASPRLRAMLATREAWGHAQLGDTYHFEAAVNVAQELHDRNQVSAEPTFLTGFDAAELHGTIGSRYRDLARHDRAFAKKAVGHLHQALRLRVPDKKRNRAFDLISLGRVHLLLGEAEHAADVVGSALDVVNHDCRGRLGRKASEWAREAAGFGSSTRVDEVRDRINKLTADRGA